MDSPLTIHGFSTIFFVSFIELTNPAHNDFTNLSGLSTLIPNVLSKTRGNTTQNIITPAVAHISANICFTVISGAFLIKSIIY